jgi:hypothetical protein
LEVAAGPRKFPVRKNQPLAEIECGQAVDQESIVLMDGLPNN